MTRIVRILMISLSMMNLAAALEPAATEDDAVRQIREVGLGKVLKVETRDDVYRIRVLTPDGIVREVDVPRKRN